MFVITADQIDSRNDRDRAGEMIARLAADHGSEFTLPPDQTSGDEIQVMMPQARTALDTILALHRAGYWSIGLGVGEVRTPLPASTRQAAGEAFVAARAAVTRAKRAEAHFALETSEPESSELETSENADKEESAETLDTAGDGSSPTGEDVEALLTMLLLLRQRRSREGWEAVELLEQGLAQVDIAAALGISTAAVSQRVKAALWRVEQAARPALVRLLENLDRA